MSTIAAFRPASCAATAREIARLLFPVPPFWVTKARTCMEAHPPQRFPLRDTKLICCNAESLNRPRSGARPSDFRIGLCPPGRGSARRFRGEEDRADEAIRPEVLGIVDLHE